MVHRSLRRGARAGGGLRPLVGGDGARGRVGGSCRAGGRAAVHGSGRVGYLSECAGAARTARHGPLPRPRHERAAARRHGGPGARHVSRRDDHGALWVARDVHRARPRLARVAHSLVTADALGARGDARAEHGRRSLVCGHSAAAGPVGHGARQLLLELRVLLRVHLAAALPGSRAQAVAPVHDAPDERRST